MIRVGDENEMSTTTIVCMMLDGEITPPKARGKSHRRAKSDSPKAVHNEQEAQAAQTGVHACVGKGVAGLFLKVEKSNAGRYFQRYRLNGKRRYMGHGSRDRVAFADACKLAREAAVQRDQGHDPIELRNRKKAANLIASRNAARAAGKLTFAKAAEVYLDIHGRKWKHRYARQGWINPLRSYAYPVIGDLALDDITYAHVVAVMRAAEAGKTKRATRDWRATTGREETARRVRARIEQVIDAAIVTGGRDPTRGNPAARNLIAKAHPLRRRGERAHFRAIALEDAPAIFGRILNLCDTSTAFSVWAFMIVTASRPSEALGAQWGEIDLVKGLWTKPGARMKAGREHVTPLNSIALRVLERQMKVRTGDPVFPGRSGSPISYTGFARAPSEAGIDAGTPHGWRSIFRDWAGDIGDIPRKLAEAALAHSLGETEGAYRRRTAVEKRRAVMDRYAQWLLGETANVVAFPARATA
jgi:integrase